MSESIRLWRTTGGTLLEVPQSRLDLEERIENWICEDISILSDELLIIGRQVTTGYGGIIDLLCIDTTGDLVIIELKKGQTPREVVAQALDYASWVKGLSQQDIVAIADRYLSETTNTDLPTAFAARFNEDLPDAINEEHSMLVVGSHIDDSSERIVRYLSEDYGVGINVAAFNYFRTSEGDEFIARTFLVEPEEVEYQKRSSRRSKRRPMPTREEFEELFEERGVSELYAAATERLSRLLRWRRAASMVGFEETVEGGRRKMISFVPEESSAEKGLGFQILTHPLSLHFGLQKQELVAVLPADHRPWEYMPDEEYQGFEGHFCSTHEVDTFLQLLESRA